MLWVLLATKTYIVDTRSQENICCGYSLPGKHVVGTLSQENIRCGYSLPGKHVVDTLS